MQQIAMAAFDVHEIEADIRGEFGGSDHVRGDGSEFLVAQDVDVLAQSVLLGKRLVVFCDSRLHLLAFRATEASGVGQLQADHQVVRRADLLLMTVLERIQQLCEVGFIVFPG